MSAIPAATPMRSPWRMALVAECALLAAIGLLYRDTAAGMIEIWWRSETFAHAFLVLPISLWLTWRQREALARLLPRPRPAFAIALLAAGALWLLADLASVNTASQFAFVAMLVLSVPTVLGSAVARAILFPLLFLFFMVPFGEFLMPWLMDHTADFTVFALRLSGIPVFREGNHFSIPSGNWSVVEACSGVRYLIASLMVGTLFAYLNFRSTRRRALFIGVAAIVPIFANWLRAYMVVMIGHLSGNRLAVGVDHLVYGWLFFGIVVTVMFMIGSRWSEPDAPVAERTAGGVPAAVALPSWPALLAALAMLAAPIGIEHALLRAEGQPAAPKLVLPAQFESGWSSTQSAPSDWTPVFQQPSIHVARAYGSRAGTVGVYVAYYRSQDPQHKLVSSENVLVRADSHDWTQIDSGRREVRIGERSLRVATADVLAAAKAGIANRPRLTVWRVYWIDGRFIADDAPAKLAGAIARLRGHGDDGAALVLHAEGAGANAALQAFVADNLADIERLLEHTRDTR